MSKSKGEFLTVSLLKEKGYDPLCYRLFCLQSHYRRGLLFTWENLDNAKTAYEKLVARVAALKHEPEDPADQETAQQLRATFREALDNDLNTSLAVTALYDVLKAKVSDGTKRTLIGEFDQVLVPVSAGGGGEAAGSQGGTPGGRFRDRRTGSGPYRAQRRPRTLPRQTGFGISWGRWALFWWIPRRAPRGTGKPV